jgi:hypothetical protein
MSTVHVSTGTTQKPGGAQPTRPEQKPKDRPAQPQPSRPQPRRTNDLHARLEAIKRSRAIEASVVSLRDQR